MKKALVRILTLLLPCLFTSPANATHVVGGQIEYTWLSGMDYEFQVTFYRDCNPGNASMPLSTTLCFFDKVTNIQYSTLTLNIVNDDTLSLGDACYTPTGLCVERGVFKGTITMTANPNGYYIIYSLCCRNNIITNISNPGSVGMTWYAEMPDPALQNSSPKFGSYPNAYLCNSVNNLQDLSANDVNGDVLTYSIVDPWDDNGCVAAPYPVVPYAPGYSLANLLGGTSTLSINPTTGMLSAYPVNAGVFVISIRVEEYRNNVKIGEIRRDMQYSVLNCTTGSTPVLSLNQPNIVDTIIGGKNHCFQVKLNAINVSGADLLTLIGASPELASPSENLPTVTFVYDTTRTPDSIIANVCVNAPCHSIRTNPYYVTYYGIDSSCAGIDTAMILYTFYVVPPGDLENPPNIITPNGDALNDFFSLTKENDLCFDHFNIDIYNRWGNHIYESEDYAFRWDGKTKTGNNVSNGVYYYIINAGFMENTYQFTGFVHVNQ
ncbi:MAG: gliding motility-associated C-terminal domain-containing protein [Bacteroidia bacterium]|nr:gliding motility-associated C-terminal domain-containing protein [Bacteroidia bacterium]